MPKVIDDKKVFSATIEILVNNGYENATTKAIAAAAGIHEATLFRKYGSKFELIDKAIYHHFLDTALNKLSYSGVLEDDIFSILRAYVEVSEIHGDVILLLFFEVARNTELQQFMYRPWKNIQVALSIIEKYQVEGLLREEAPLTTLFSLIGPIMIGNMAQKMDFDVAVPMIDIQQQVETFLHGRSK